MNAFTGTRKTRATAIGISALAAGGLLTAGLAMPAAAADWSAEHGDSSTTETSNWTDIANDLIGSVSTGLGVGDVLGDVLGDVADGGIANGDVSNSSPVVVAPGDIGSGNEVGDVGSGNEVGSGNDVGSGNEVGSGNDVQAPIGSGNETNVDLGGIEADVDDVVGDVTGSVDGIVEDVTGSVDIGGIVDDVTGAIDLGGLGN
ncbi:hypothetical protein [Agromyces aerolatus]|uniref:hypothetical protein n=1 Tax=Agromyces sp. LY-1074 TaxID=3074080 RepID=UPI00285CF8FC|nr:MULTISPECIES: hypothetical protein [unclassified Agromyces]MDR5701713.1 hypothetical protein [Agromyces sp. LY-1074]MDR5707940.1 hypothetical protein [Agromyces sp. LY-1358]